MESTYSQIDHIYNKFFEGSTTKLGECDPTHVIWTQA